MDKNRIKYLRSLHQKKYRQLNSEFIVEGNKLVNELLKSDFEIKNVYAVDAGQLKTESIEIEHISPKELDRISTSKSPNNSVAVAALPEGQLPSMDTIAINLSLVLENIQDPGNMGTILRLANWFGIQHIFCNAETVECYNPKVVQSSMGALFRVKVHYTDIYTLIAQTSDLPDFNIYATLLDGENLYETEISDKGFIIMGNESQGLTENINMAEVKKIKIPSFPEETSGMESLNVAIATAITVAEFRRRTMD